MLKAEEKVPGATFRVLKKTYHNEAVTVGHVANLLCSSVAHLAKARSFGDHRRSVSK